MLQRYNEADDKAWFYLSGLFFKRYVRCLASLHKVALLIIFSPRWGQRKGAKRDGAGAGRRRGRGRVCEGDGSSACVSGSGTQRGDASYAWKGRVWVLTGPKPRAIFWTWPGQRCCFDGTGLRVGGGLNLQEHRRVRADSVKGWKETGYGKLG